MSLPHSISRTFDHGNHAGKMYGLYLETHL